MEPNFNSLGELEIPDIALSEFIANALVHRSLVWKMPVRVFIFDDRVEIHSPANLPAGMTVESMVAGVSMPRNDLLFNNAIYLLPYTGAGSGLRRAMDTGVEVQFNDNEKTREFVITIPRKEHHIVASMHKILFSAKKPIKRDNSKISGIFALTTTERLRLCQRTSDSPGGDSVGWTRSRI